MIFEKTNGGGEFGDQKIFAIKRFTGPLGGKYQAFELITGFIPHRLRKYTQLNYFQFGL